MKPTEEQGASTVLPSDPLPPALASRGERLVDAATEYLRTLILDHRLQPGTMLIQSEWAEHLGISRTPLREAFRLLEQDGLVRISNGNRTVEVVRYTNAELTDLYQLREVIDGLAARLLAQHGLSSEEHAELRGLLNEMDDASDPFRSSAFFAAHTAFHMRIAESCGNLQVRKLINIVRITGLALHTPMTEAALPGAKDPIAHILQVGRVQHRAIFDAIRLRMPGDAEAAARRHIVTTLRSDLIKQATEPDAT